MRKIKVRAWDKRNNKWIGQESLVMNNGLLFEDWRAFVDWFPLSEDEAELVESTGIKDKNGIEIYEGDILKAGDGYTGLIGYRTESAQFVGFNIGNEFTEEEFDTLYTVNGSFNSAEVIGNRFETPELLKEEQE